MKRRRLWIAIPVMTLVFGIMLTACSDGSGDLPVKTINWETDNSGWMQFYTNDPQYYGYGFLRYYDNSQANAWEIVCKKMNGYRNQGFGLLFAVADNSHYCRLLITSNGSYNVQKRNGDVWTTILDWANSAKINTGNNKENTLKVTKSGSAYAIFINSEQVSQFNDSAASGNRFGLFVSVGSEANEDFPNTPVDVRFKVK
jgi:hypothetical protein